MLLERDQLTAYELAGTVPLPSPFPASGPVWIAFQRPAGGKPIYVFLKVIHHVAPRLRIARLVRLEDVRGIRILKSCEPAAAAPTESRRPAVAPPPADHSAACEWEQWSVADLHARVRDAVDKHEPKSDDEFPLFPNAILYVPETAPVLMQVDAGMTAAESAEYYPPTSVWCDGLRCDGQATPTTFARRAFCEFK